MTHDHLIAKIQPYVDDELPPDARAEVEAQLAANADLRAMVDEQRAVRAALQTLRDEPAPRALQARVLLELDAVDRELATKSAPKWQWPRFWALLRGATVMVPAGATALALFLAIRVGTDDSAANVQANVQANQTNWAAPANLSTPLLDPSQVALYDEGPASPVTLVGATVPSNDHVIMHQLGSRRVIEHHQPARGPVPGQPREFRGHRYWLGHVAGQPAIVYEVNGTRHTLTSNGPGFTPEREYLFLLSLGAALQATEAP